MDTPDFNALMASITRCNAVYEPDDTKARTLFANLGCTVIDRYCDAGHQAIIHRDPEGYVTLTIAGTRISEGTLREHAVDLFEDIDFIPQNISADMMVATGALEGLGELFGWALSLIAPEDSVRIEGHSLGGQRAHLAPLFVPLSQLDRLIAWEPPKAANDAYYQAHADWFTRALTIINGADPWAAWPWMNNVLQHPPGKILWLHRNAWAWTTRDSWPGGRILQAADHDTNQVMRAVHACCALTT
jgi:hypothetical protein